MIDFLGLHAAEVVKAPPGWAAYEYEAIGDHPGPTKVIRVIGAVAPPKTRGENKGRPNWRKMDKTTVRTAYFTPDEHKQWLAEWEAKTGNCSECGGDGEVFAGWNVETGTRKKPCKKCEGTGKAHN